MQEKNLTGSKKFSERLRVAVGKSGLRKGKLADLVGAHPVSLSRWLKDRTPDAGTVMKLADALGVRFQWLLTGEEPMIAHGAGSGRVTEEAQPVNVAGLCKLMRDRREKLGISFAELGRLTGYSPAVLQAVEEGQGRASERMVDAICRELRLSIDEFVRDCSPDVIRDNVFGTYGAKPEFESYGAGAPRFVPLISMAQAGTISATTFTDGAYNYDGVLAFDVKDHRAFGVKLVGDSMAPNYSAGDVAIVYPSSQPRSGDVVIARLSDEAGGDIMFKLYSPKDGGRRVVLSSYNPAFPPVEYGRSDFLWIYPVAAVLKTLRH